MPMQELIDKMSEEELKESYALLKAKMEALPSATQEEQKPVEDEHNEEQPNVEENELVGGKGDNNTVDDIAKKHNVTLELIDEQLKKGIEVEMEHTNDPEKAREIALDHLTEKADYYDALAKVENNNVPNVYFDKKLEEVVKTMDERFEQLIERVGKQLDTKNDTILALEKQIEELKRTTPTQIVKPTLTQGSFESPRESEIKKANNSWFESPSSVMQKFK